MCELEIIDQIRKGNSYIVLRNLEVCRQTYNICLEAVKTVPNSLMWVKSEYRTPELCLEAVRGNGLTLQYIDSQTPELCLAAVKQKGYALEFVKDQTEEICMEAVKQKGNLLYHIKSQTPEICLAAVRNDGYAIMHVKDQTPEICMEAVKNDGWALQHVKNQTPEICLAAVKQNGKSIYYIANQTLELCLEAVKQSPFSIQFINMGSFFTESNIIRVIKKDIRLIKFPSFWWKGDIKNKMTKSDFYFKILKSIGMHLIKHIPVSYQTLEMCEEAVKQDGLLISSMSINNGNLLSLMAVQQNGLALKYITSSSNQTAEICMAAVRQNPYSFKYMCNQYKYNIGILVWVVKVFIQSQSENLSVEELIEVFDKEYFASRHGLDSKTFSSIDVYIEKIKNKDLEILKYIPDFVYGFYDLSASKYIELLSFIISENIELNKDQIKYLEDLGNL